MLELLSWQSSLDTFSHSVFMSKLLHQQSLYEGWWKALGAIFLLLSHMHVRIVIQDISTIICYPILHSKLYCIWEGNSCWGLSPPHIFIWYRWRRRGYASRVTVVLFMLCYLHWIKMLLNSTWCFQEMWFFLHSPELGLTSGPVQQAWLLKINDA